MADGRVVASGIDLAATAALGRVAKAVTFYLNLGLGRVRANASGRPGPRRVTGDYLRSMSVEYDGIYAGTIGTNAPQGRRLEFGFTGTDSLGRHYNQPPLAHWRPMADFIDAKFAEAVAHAIVTE